MLTSEMIKEAALAAGADKCGIGSMDRFEGAPPDMDPRRLFPEARSVIGLVYIGAGVLVYALLTRQSGTPMGYAMDLLMGPAACPA